MLDAIERRDDWAGLARLAALTEGYIRIVEPETDVVLVRRRERDWRLLVIAERDRECFHAEDTAHRGTTHTRGIGLNVRLIPRNTKWLIGQFDDEEVKASVGWKAGDAHCHCIIQ